MAVLNNNKNIQSWKLALMRNLASDLINYEKLVLTLKRAKLLQVYMEKLITIAKQETLHAHRQVNNYLRNIKTTKNITVSKKLFTVLLLKFKQRQGGYTKILKLNQPRKGDNATLAIIQFS